MRISNKMIADILTNELYRNKQLLLESQIRVATGKKINKPSDDPIGIGKVLDYRKIISSIEQYNENITNAKNQIEFSDTLLDQVETLLNQAEQWGTQITEGYNIDTPEDREALRVILEGIYDDIMNIANSKIGDNYIYGGHVTDTQPFARDASFSATYTGDDGDFNMLVGENVQIKVNSTGQDIFDVGGTGEGTDIFGALQDLIVALSLGGIDAIKAAASSATDNITSGIEQVQNVMTVQSVNYERLKYSESFLTKYLSNIQNALDSTENVDLEQAVVEMQLQETAYTTNLETSAKIIQSTLLDYL